jgi:Transposase domain (DUF772)
MRGDDSRRDGLFSYVRSEDRIPKGHPLRVIRQLANAALDALSPRFDEVYAQDGRPSIPPEQLLRALLLQAFYSIRSERILILIRAAGTSCAAYGLGSLLIPTVPSDDRFGWSCEGPLLGREPGNRPFGSRPGLPKREGSFEQSAR